MNIFDLRQQRAQLVASMRELMDRCNDTAMSAEDQTEYSRMEAEFDTLTGSIDAMERQQERERRIGEHHNPEPTPADNTRMEMFGRALSGRASDLSRYMNDVNYTLGTDATAGYITAPVQFVEQMIRGLDDDVFMRRISHQTPRLGNAQSLGFPYRATEASDAEWTGEVSEADEEQQLTFGRREFKPNRMAKLVKLSRTLVNHAALAPQAVLDEIRYRIAITQEKAYLTGDGSGEPLGIFTASNSGIPTTRDVSADNTATAVTMDGLYNAKYSLKQQYMRAAQWVMHRDLVKMVAKLKDGEGQYLWQPSTQLGQPDMLLGLPCNISEYAPNTFTTGQYVAAIGDFRYYWIMDADGLAVQVLNEKYATANQVGYLFQYFGDGAPVLGEAFARVKLG